MSNKIGKIKPVEITEEMQKSYLDYAMSVIVARALPDVRDGLKPVHRRILFAMHGMGLTHSAKHTKSAKVVGECFVKDTLILTKKGLIPIQRIKVGDQVYTQGGIKKVIQLYEMPQKPLLKITSESGVSNLVTPSQKFKILTPNWKFRWKEAKNLTDNDYLAVRATYPEINQLIQLIKIEKNQPKYLNKNLAYLLGLYLAHGWISEDYSKKKLPRISFTAGNSKEIAQKIVSIFEKEFNYRPTIETISYPPSKCYNIRVNRKAINEFIISNFSLRGKKAPTKIIPQQIFRSPKKVIFSFISGLIDGDGHVAAERRRVHYASVSKTLIDQLLILLQHQGIFASKYVRKPSQKDKIKGKYFAYSLEICGQDATKLISQLELIEVRKNKRLANKKNYSKKIKKEWGNSDIVPYAGRILFRELSHAHLGGGWYQNPNGHKFRKGIKYPSGCKIRYSSNLQEKPLRKNQIIGWGIKDKLEKINSKYSEFLNNIIKKQIHFSKVASIKKVAPQKTYDIQVKDDHEFIANGMVSHNCMGKYHPHGDLSIYDALVRLAQDFSMRYPLIDGQGNFGSIDGDSPAAMRYTETKMSKIALEMLTDIDKNTVDYLDNFDASLKEPAFLPAKIPNLLLMGSDGIAVGMATKIPPHNLKEVIDGLSFLIDKGKVISTKAKAKNQFEIKKIQLEEPANIEKVKQIPALQASFESKATVEEIIKYIKGPDFPTGASIYDKDQILQAYSTGKGKILMRAIAEIEKVKGDKYRIVINQIPYQVNKAQLVTKIAQLVKEKKIRGVSSLRDESDRQGMRIVLELKRTARPKVILNSLYKHTPMQTTYPVNMVALVDGVPQTLTLKQILTEFIKHRQSVITRRSIFELEAAKKRAHILKGLKIALDHLDAVITTIKKSRTAETARGNLIKKFKLTEIQANAILEMQLRRLAALERKKIEDEYQEIGKKIDSLTNILTHPEKIFQIIKKELKEIKQKYGDPRRTKIYRQQLESFSEEDLIAKEKCLITITKTGYIKRLPVGTYRSQRRGGKGVRGMTTKEADEISQFMIGETHDQVLFFTNKGRVFSIRAWEISEGARSSKGQAVINLINIDQGEKVNSVLNLPSQSAKTKNKYLLMATRKGVVKKTVLKHFKKIRTSGLIAIKLNRDDELCWVKPTTGQDQVLLANHNGKSIRFNETDVRPMGRDTIGVRGISLKGNDYVVGMEVFPVRAKRPKDRRRKYFRDVLVVMENGLGKRTNIRYHPIQKRGGIGVKAANVTKKTGKIIACRLVTQKDKQVILTSRKAQVIKLPLKNIPRLRRGTQGVILMRFSKPDDSVAAMTCLEK